MEIILNIFSAIIGFVIILIWVLLVYVMIQYKTDANSWNYGHCKNCGEMWEYVERDVNGARHYKCSNCGNHIKVICEVDNVYKW